MPAGVFRRDGGVTLDGFHIFREYYLLSVIKSDIISFASSECRCGGIGRRT